MSDTTKHTERIPTHIAESYAGRGVVHGAWRDVVRDLAADLVAARAQLAARPDPAAVAHAVVEAASAGAARAVRRYFQSGDEKMGDHLARIVAVEVDATDVTAIIAAATKGPTP